jgi:IPT/TIG domain
MAQQVILLTGGATWTPPANAVGSNAKIVCITGGDDGAAGGCSVGNGGSGGGCAVKNAFFIPSTTPINIQIGGHGPSSDTWFNSTGTVRAVGQNGTVGDVLHSGGAGGSGNPCTNTGGGGGGAASETANGVGGGVGGGGNSGSGASGGGGNTNGSPGTEYAITAGGTAGAGGGGGGGVGSCCANPPGASGGLYGGGGGGGDKAPGGGGQQGAIIIIYTPITVTSVVPNVGACIGNNTVTINGSGFTGVSSATIGGVAVSNISFINDTQITCKVGPHNPPGLVNVTVTATAGTGTGTNLYTFQSWLPRRYQRNILQRKYVN